MLSEVLTYLNLIWKTIYDSQILCVLHKVEFQDVPCCLSWTLFKNSPYPNAASSVILAFTQFQKRGSFWGHLGSLYALIFFPTSLQRSLSLSCGGVTLNYVYSSFPLADVDIHVARQEYGSMPCLFLKEHPANYCISVKWIASDHLNSPCHMHFSY